jgi:Na+-driven multidrug efflux pump
MVAVGAIGLSSRVTQMIWALFKGISTGASVFVAQAYGAGNLNKLKAVIQQTLLSSVALVILLQEFIYWKAPLLLSVFNTSDNLMANGLIYLRTVSWGLPFVVIMLVVAGVLQGMGNAKTPMKIALLMNVINIIVSFVLIFGYAGFSPMGIRGSPGNSICTVCRGDDRTLCVV